MKAASRGLLAEEDEGREVLSSEGEPGLSALRRLCLDGLWSSETLASHYPSLRSADSILLFQLFIPICSEIFIKYPTHYLSNFYLKLILFSVLINFSFSFFAGTEEVEGGDGVEEVYSMPGGRGTPGAGVHLGWYPCKLASRPSGCQGPWS